MNWHIFALVWGEPFVARFAELTIRFLAMPGNVPALAESGAVTFHVYTDPASREAVSAALAPLKSWSKLDIRIFDDAPARRFGGPTYKYEVQRWCLRELTGSLSDGTMILLDSNFLPADGSLAALARRRAEGYRAAVATCVRVSAERMPDALGSVAPPGAPIGPRPLVRACLNALHHATSAFFMDAERFTPYPSQISWRVDADGFVTRNFLPHPLMVPVSQSLLKSQSTMDYDMALRLAADDEIYRVTDSDEILLAKYSDDEHISLRDGASVPTEREIGLFILCCTNHRHRAFADAPILFHCGELNPRFSHAIDRSHAFIAAAYAWVDALAARPGTLDAKTLMYLKSYLGPIEDFMSPQLEPSMLSRLP